MSSKERGGLSKREYARKMGAQQGGGMPSGDFYTTSQEIKNSLMRQYSQITGDPNTFQMKKDQYLASGGGQLDRDIQKAQRTYYDEGMDAMERYSNIQNPNMRRALAEQSQNVAQMSVTGLTDERTRRQQVIDDYIATWSYTYGAQAKAAQGGSGSTTAQKSEFLLDAQEALNSSVGEDGKADPSVYAELRDMGIKYGMNANDFDNYFKVKVGEHEYGNLAIKQPETKVRTPKQQAEDAYYEEYNSAKKSEKDAVHGEKYVDDDGNIWIKVDWGRDKLVMKK